jgi:hypothetical protein
MISMNLIFHLFSAVLAFVLAWYIVRMRADMKFTTQLLSGAKSGHANVRIFVDSPYSFLKRLSAIMDIPLDDEHFTEADAPIVKIDGSLILKYCLEYGVTSIRIKTLGQKQMMLEFTAAQLPDSEGGAKHTGKEKLAAAFGGKISVELNKLQTVRTS